MGLSLTTPSRAYLIIDSIMRFFIVDLIATLLPQCRFKNGEHTRDIPSLYSPCHRLPHNTPRMVNTDKLVCARLAWLFMRWPLSPST